VGASACTRIQRQNSDLGRDLRGIRRRGRQLERAHIRRVRRFVAGTLAMGAVEYSKLRAERDQQVAQLAKERVQIETAPDAELDELTQLYVSRGLSPGLARQVAIELTAHDALAAHAEAEYGITPASLTSPLRDALAVGVRRGRHPSLAGHGADTRAVESACDLRDRPAGVGVDGLDLGADVGRPPSASDNPHGRHRCSVDADHLHRWSRAPSVISTAGAAKSAYETVQRGGQVRRPQPSALTTPIGHDTPVPWSGQYPCGFLASDRYCWCEQYLSELSMPQSRGETMTRPASVAALRSRSS
jgi:hypothetical protein